MISRIAVVLVAVGLLASVSAGAAEVWMGKSNPWPLGKSQEWPYVQEHLDTLLMFIDQIHFADMEDLRALVKVLDENEIKIAVELGGLVDWRASAKDKTAELSFADESAKLRKLTAPVSEGGAGGTVSYLNIDGAVHRIVWTNNKDAGYHDFESATDEYVEMVKLWRAEYPDIKLNILTNFPNWGWKGGPAYFNFGLPAGKEGWGDYHEVLSLIVKKTRAAGIPMDGLVVDNPYGYATGKKPTGQPEVTKDTDWMARILDIEAFARKEGLSFILIANSEAGGAERGGSGDRYQKETMEFIRAYQARGGKPDVYLLESWYAHPKRWVPETEHGTMAALVKEAIAHLKKP